MLSAVADLEVLKIVLRPFTDALEGIECGVPALNEFDKQNERGAKVSHVTTLMIMRSQRNIFRLFLD